MQGTHHSSCLCERKKQKEGDLTDCHKNEYAVHIGCGDHLFCVEIAAEELNRSLSPDPRLGRFYGALLQAS